MNITSQYLGEVDILRTPSGLEPVVRQDFTDIESYSRFKFGDGEVGGRYGATLGSLVLNEAVELLNAHEVHVTSSAFRVAPPASESLVGPFLASADAAAREEGAATTFSRFKIGKSRLATDNYAGMSFEERSQTLQSDLVLPSGLELEGQSVIILDDIRVTGLRQAALESLLEGAGVARASFYYVLHVPDGKVYPQTEAIINARSVKTIDDILELAIRPGFVPNVRLCKFILSQTLNELERFCSSVPSDVRDVVLHYIEADNLKEVVKAIP
jgi:hypothetical protein